MRKANRCHHEEAKLARSGALPPVGSSARAEVADDANPPIKEEQVEAILNDLLNLWRDPLHNSGTVAQTASAFCRKGPE